MNEEKEFKINIEFLKSRPLSYSSLKEFSKSPRHYLEYIKGVRVESDSIVLGSVVDLLLFNPEDLHKKYMLVEKKSRSTKDGKEYWQQCINEASEKKKKIITKDVYENAQKCVSELKLYPTSKYFIDNLRNNQIRLTWTDKETGLPLIGFVDGESREDASFNYMCWDLKTTTDASDNGFMRSIINYNYYLQIGVYSLGYQRKFFRFPQWYFVVVETTEPYNVNVLECSQKMIQHGKDEVMFLLKAFKKCMEENLWHMSYDFWLFNTQKNRIIDLPPYAKLHYINESEY